MTLDTWQIIALCVGMVAMLAVLVFDWWIRWQYNRMEAESKSNLEESREILEEFVACTEWHSTATPPGASGDYLCAWGRDAFGPGFVDVSYFDEEIGWGVKRPAFWRDLPAHPATLPWIANSEGP